MMNARFPKWDINIAQQGRALFPVNNALLIYTVSGIAQTKKISRQLA